MKNYALLIVGGFFFTGMAVANAQTPTLIQFDYTPGEGPAGFLNTLYMLLITVAALFAVIKIILAGVKYMVSDVVPSKQSAKDDIKNALLGLIIILATYLILYRINPELTELDVFENISEIRVQEPISIQKTAPPQSLDDAASALFNDAAANAAGNVNGGCNIREPDNTDNPKVTVIVIDFSGCPTTYNNASQTGIRSPLWFECEEKNGNFNYDQSTRKLTCTYPNSDQIVMPSNIYTIKQQGGVQTLNRPDDISSTDWLEKIQREESWCKGRLKGSFSGTSRDTVVTCTIPTIIDYNRSTKERVAQSDCSGRNGKFNDGWFWDQCIIR